MSTSLASNSNSPSHSPASTKSFTDTRINVAPLDENPALIVETAPEPENEPILGYYGQKIFMGTAWFNNMLAMVSQGGLAALEAHKIQANWGVPSYISPFVDALTGVGAGEGKRALVWSLGYEGYVALSKTSWQDVKNFWNPFGWTAWGIAKGAVNATLTTVASTTFAGLAVMGNEGMHDIFKKLNWVVNETDISKALAIGVNSRAAKLILSIPSLLANLQSFRSGINPYAAYHIRKLFKYLNEDPKVKHQKDLIRRFMEAHRLKHKKDYEAYRNADFQDGADQRNYADNWNHISSYKPSDLIDWARNKAPDANLVPPALKEWEFLSEGLFALILSGTTAAGLYNFRTLAPIAIEKFLELFYLGFLVQNPYVRTALGLIDFTAMTGLAMIGTFGMGLNFADWAHRKYQGQDNSFRVHSKKKLFLAAFFTAILVVLGGAPNAYQSFFLASESLFMAIIALLGSVAIELIPLFKVVLSVLNFISPNPHLFAKEADKRDVAFNQAIEDLFNASEGKIDEVYNAMLKAVNLAFSQEFDLKNPEQSVQTDETLQQNNTNNQPAKAPDEVDSKAKNSKNLLKEFTLSTPVVVYTQPPAPANDSEAALNDNSTGCYGFVKSCVSSAASSIAYYASCGFFGRNSNGYTRIPTTDLEAQNTEEETADQPSRSPSFCC